MCFADGNQGKVAADFVNANYAGQTIGVFYKADEAYSKGIYDQFKANLDASITVVETSFTDANATDFSTQIDTLKNCGFIFMPIYYTPASLFLMQGKDIVAPTAVYYGCDGFDGIDAIEGFDINSVKQEVSYLSHFNSTATEGPAAEFIAKYNDKYDESKEPVNQFGAAAYDCVYAIYEALKVAKANGKDITATTSASDFCEILTEVFTSDSFTFRGITGKCEGNERSYISWSDDGTVQKEAIKYVVKSQNN
jgi:branched-chain amino acid transport system substrate-binding protein